MSLTKNREAKAESWPQLNPNASAGLWNNTAEPSCFIDHHQIASNKTLRNSVWLQEVWRDFRDCKDYAGNLIPHHIMCNARLSYDQGDHSIRVFNANTNNLICVGKFQRSMRLNSFKDYKWFRFLLLRFWNSRFPDAFVDLHQGDVSVRRLHTVQPRRPGLAFNKQ